LTPGIDDSARQRSTAADATPVEAASISAAPENRRLHSLGRLTISVDPAKLQAT
jgi:hypothetical protein